MRDNLESDYHEPDEGNAISGAVSVLTVVAFSALILAVGWWLLVVVTS